MLSVRLCILLSGLMLLSCHHGHPQLQAITEGLETSTRILEANCDTTVHALMHGSHQETDQYRAVQWQPIVAKSTLMARQAADYIDSLQKELKVTHKIADEHIKTLFDTLIHYKQSLPGLFHILLPQPDSRYVEQDLSWFYASLAILPGYPVSGGRGSDYSRWKDSTFDDEELLMRAALAKLKHDLIVSAYQLIQFSRRKFAEIVEDFTQIETLAGLSSGVVKPGEMIQVTAGIGSFRIELRPIITINNKKVKLDGDAVAIGTVRSPEKPGKYSVPVRFEYTKPDGSTAWKDCKLYYQVVAPCAP